MQVPSELDKAVEYTKQFIDAVTPIAKQAYEIGLMTLRIDAAQSFISCFFLMVFGLFVLRRIRKDWLEAKRVASLPENAQHWYSCAPSDHLPVDGGAHLIGLLVGCFATFSGVMIFSNVWLWVKLFVPQLWLAHQAIEKLVK